MCKHIGSIAVPLAFKKYTAVLSTIYVAHGPCMVEWWPDNVVNATVHCGTACLPTVEAGGVMNGTYHTLVLQYYIQASILVANRMVQHALGFDKRRALALLLYR